MRKKWFQAALTFAAISITLLMFGCAERSGTVSTQAQTGAKMAQAESSVYTGSVVGKSNKAKTVSIEVGKGADAQTYMLKFDDKTIGIENAEPGEATIITWEQRGDDKFAVEIKPKLASLPEGITEIKVEELQQLMERNVPMTLVDARPESRYQQAHLPGAINIPVPKLQEKKEAALPADKNGLLIFYCGGYT